MNYGGKKTQITDCQMRLAFASVEGTRICVFPSLPLFLSPSFLSPSPFVKQILVTFNSWFGVS